MVNPYYDRRSAERVRATTRKRRLRKGLWRSLLVLLLAISLISLALQFRLHRIRNITITGAGVLAPEIKSLMSPCLGRPLWRSGAQELINRIISQYPAIKECRVAILPGGWLLVRTELRGPVARLDDSGVRVIDEEGICFCLPQGGGGHLPRLDLTGSSYEGRMRAITAILASGGSDSCWVFESQDPNNIKLRMPGATVLLGNGRFPEKWTKLREILKNRETISDPCIIDLRFHDQAVLKRTV